MGVPLFWAAHLNTPCTFCEVGFKVPVGAGRCAIRLAVHASGSAFHDASQDVSVRADLRPDPDPNALLIPARGCPEIVRKKV